MNLDPELFPVRSQIKDLRSKMFYISLGAEYGILDYTHNKFWTFLNQLRFHAKGPILPEATRNYFDSDMRVCCFIAAVLGLLTLE